MTKVLITGGCGFIGSNFIRWFLEQEPDIAVVNVDALTYAGNLANLAVLDQHPRYRFVKADITDRNAMAKVIDGVDSVIHFAAESHVDRSIMDSGPFLKTNIIGTQVLLDVARAAKVRRFVQVSTDEVYGSLGPTGAFTETTPLHPNSPYSASKAAADMLVQAYVHTFGIDAVITRCSNNYGPFQFPEKLIPLFISNLLADKEVPVYGDGMQVRDWIHVRDHCSGVHAAWKHGKSGEVYNFGGRCEKPNLELTHLLIDLLGKPRTLIKYVQDRPGHDRRYAIDCSKAERELGWKPAVPFDRGLQETIDWYKANEEWVKNVRSGEYLKYYQKQYGGADSLLDSLLQKSLENGGSGLFLEAGAAPGMWIKGDLVLAEMTALTQDDLESILTVLEEPQRRVLEETGEIDFNHVLGKDDCRFNVNVTKRRGQIRLTARRLDS